MENNYFKRYIEVDSTNRRSVTNLKDKIFNLTFILSSFIKIIFYKVFSWPRLFVDQIVASESINNFLNLKSLYRVLVNIAKL